MHSRQEVEQIIRNAYEERKKGDLQRVLACFTDDARFCQVGSDQQAVGRMQTEQALKRVIDAFELLDYKIHTILVEGDKAAVHWHGRFRASNGKTDETDLLDLLEIKNGRIASFHNFFDTAKAQQLLQA